MAKIRFNNVIINIMLFAQFTIPKSRATKKNRYFINAIVLGIGL